MTGGAGSATGSGVTTWAGSPVWPAAIPLGDGKVTTTCPRVGYVYPCASQFRGAGARRSGSWINTAAGTWNAKAKLHGAGANSQPDASHSFTVSGANRILKTSDLPAGATTGNFPIAPSDPAYRYDTNPNHVVARSFDWKGPATPPRPVLRAAPAWARSGSRPTGWSAPMPFDASGRDAGAHETQDACDGHPQGQGIYHYHTYSPYLPAKASQRPGSSTLAGYALDSYGIYPERDDHGNLPADADPDACHGRTSAITRDGKRVVMYHYDVTLEYPYTVGRYHGTRSARTRHQGGQMPGQRPSRCPAFRYLGPGGWSRTWVRSVCRARQSASGQPYGRPPYSRGPGGWAAGSGLPVPRHPQAGCGDLPGVSIREPEGVRGRFDLEVRDDPPVVLHPWRYATGKAVSRDRATLTAFTTLEISEFCPQAGSKDGRSCDGLDGCARSWPLRRHWSSAPLPR